MSVDVLISRTPKALWENEIPNTIYEYIYSFGPEFTTKEQVHKMKRHHPILLDAFRMIYDLNISSCPFAGTVKIPLAFISLYTVQHVACYRSSYYPESVVLDTSTWIVQERERIDKKYKHGYITEKQMKYMLREAEYYTERNRGRHFLYDIKDAKLFPL